MNICNKQRETLPHSQTVSAFSLIHFVGYVTSHAFSQQLGGDCCTFVVNIFSWFA